MGTFETFIENFVGNLVGSFVASAAVRQSSRPGLCQSCVVRFRVGLRGKLRRNFHAQLLCLLHCKSPTSSQAARISFARANNPFLPMVLPSMILPLCLPLSLFAPFPCCKIRVYQCSSVVEIIWLRLFISESMLFRIRVSASSVVPLSGKSSCPNHSAKSPLRCLVPFPIFLSAIFLSKTLSFSCH